MRKIWKAAKLLFLGALVLFLAAAGTLAAVRAYRQHLTARALAIHAPNGVDEGFYVKIGGIDQWLQIRGQDRASPVLLCLHGGPGGTWIPMTARFVPWEKEFTVVQWDQRGAGKTLETTGAAVADTMSVARMAQDGIEVSEFLRKHLHQDKLILLGHSWGSILGIHMVKDRPDLFYAYVGTGQVSDMPKGQRMSYVHLLDQARSANDRKAVTALERIGPPPFDSSEKLTVFFGQLQEHLVESDRAALSSSIGSLTNPAPNYSLWDEVNRVRGFLQIPTLKVYEEMLATDLPAFAIDFQVPIFFFQGSEDDRTPATLAREYFEKINAPHKEFVLLNGGGHFAVWSMSDRFLQELTTRVRPFAAPPR
jgi:pimeloyl-ACP methyl ester carboxylesterase